MTPSIGRIVHYVEHRTHYPAIITSVWVVGNPDEQVDLVVFGIDDTPASLRTFVGHKETHDDIIDLYRNTWHWPERVE